MFLMVTGDQEVYQSLLTLAAMLHQQVRFWASCHHQKHGCDACEQVHQLQAANFPGVTLPAGNSCLLAKK